MLPGCLNFISPHPGSHPEEGWCLTGMLPSPHRAQDAQPGASSAERPESVSSQGVIPSYRTAQTFLGPTVASSSCIPSAAGWFMSPSCWVAFPPMQGLPRPHRTLGPSHPWALVLALYRISRAVSSGVGWDFQVCVLPLFPGQARGFSQEVTPRTGAKTHSGSSIQGDGAAAVPKCPACSLDAPPSSH